MARSALPARWTRPERGALRRFAGSARAAWWFGAWIAAAACGQGTVLDVTAHGVVARSSAGIVTDAGPAVRTLLTAVAQGTGPVAGLPGPFTLRFPGAPGGTTIYDFTTTSTVSGYTAHLLVTRSVTLARSALDGLVLEGDGAHPVELRFHDLKKPGLLINGGRRVRVADLTLRYDAPPFLQGVIDALGQNDATSSWVEFTIDPGFPLPDLAAPATDPYLAAPTYLVPFHPVTRLMHEGGDQLKILPTAVFAAGGGWIQQPDPTNRPRTFRMLVAKTTFLAGAGGGAFANVGDLCAWKGALGVAVTTRETDDGVFDRLVVKNSGNGAFFSALDANLVYREVRLVPDEGALLSSNLDGIHSKDNRRGPQVIRCTFERTGDDCVAISGSWHEAVPPPPGLNYLGFANPVYLRSRTRLQFRQSASQYAFDFYDGAGGATPRFARTAEAVVPLGIQYAGSYSTGGVTYHVHELGLPSGAAPVRSGDLAVCRNFVAAGFEVTGCSMRDHRARAVFVKAREGVVRGNRMENSGGPAILAGPEIGPFYEASFVEGLRIEGNDLRNVARGFGTAPTGGAISVVTTGLPAIGAPFQFENLARNNRRLEIVGNTVTRAGRAGLFLSAAADALVVDNRFFGCQYQPFAPGGPTGYGFGIDDLTAVLHLQNAAGVRLEGNWIEAGLQPLHEPLFASTASENVVTASVHAAWHAGFELRESDETPPPFDAPFVSTPEGPPVVRLHQGVFLEFLGFNAVDDDPLGTGLRTRGLRSLAAAHPRAELRLLTGGLREVAFALGADVRDGSSPLRIYAEPLGGAPVLLGVFANDADTLPGAKPPYWTTKSLVLPWDASSTPTTLRFARDGEGAAQVFLDDVVLRY